MLANPFGIIVAGPETFKETILYADIDLKVNLAAKSIINLTGIYASWDILRLAVREGEYPPFERMESLETNVSGSADETEQLKAKIGVLEARLAAVEKRSPGDPAS